MESEEAVKKIKEIIEEAKARFDLAVSEEETLSVALLSATTSASLSFQVKEKRKRLKKEGSSAPIEEDDPEKVSIFGIIVHTITIALARCSFQYKRLLYVATVKLFAEKAKKRKDLEDREASER